MIDQLFVNQASIISLFFDLAAGIVRIAAIVFETGAGNAIPVGMRPAFAKYRFAGVNAAWRTSYFPHRNERGNSESTCERHR